MDIRIDSKSFMRNMETLDKKIADATDKGVTHIANEVLRLSQREVPHDTGLLQNSGMVTPKAHAHKIVGYNKVYAARLHENPQYRFQGGRKGKYLEDPIKNNLGVFREFMVRFIKGALT